MRRGRERLDSESSDDEEARELKYFWQQMRELRAGVAAAAATAPRPGLRLALPAGGGTARSVGCGRAGPSAAGPSAAAKAAAAALPLAKRGTTPDAARAREAAAMVSAGGSSPSGRKRRGFGFVPGARLWASLAGLAIEVLCFLSAECVCRLACAAQELLEAVAPSGAHGRQLTMPHLRLCTRTCERRLKRAWLPYVMWLEARDLAPKACQLLLKGLGASGPRAVRALRVLDLRNTRLQGCAEAFVPLLRTCWGLQRLNLSRTRLRDEGGELVAQSLLGEDQQTGRLHPHQSLRFLALEENGLTSASGPRLAFAALALPSLEVLLFARNELGDESAAALAEGLVGGGAGGVRQGGAALTRLDLSENKLTAGGLAALAGALGSHGALQSLDAGGNEGIGCGLNASPVCARELAAGLRSAGTLRDLHLWRCGLSDEACDLVMDAQPPRLRLLNLAANPFSQELHNRLLRCDSYDGLALSIRV